MKILLAYQSLPKARKDLSIFDVAGYPHYENVCSNILAFYFDPKEEHGLGELLLSSFIKASTGEDLKDFDGILIYREYSTKNSGRLDIVVIGNDVALGIENKIFAPLENDLNDYSRTVNEIAEHRRKIKVVLSLYPIKIEDKDSKFINLTYSAFSEEIKKNIGYFANPSNQKWAAYLIDFIHSIDNLIGGNMELDKIDMFFIENEEIIEKLLNDRNKLTKKLSNRVSKLKELINPSLLGCEQWIYQSSCLVHDFTFSKQKISFDLFIGLNGWKLQLFGRTKSADIYLKELLATPPLQDVSSQLKLDEGRLLVNAWEDLETDLVLIKTELEKWMNYLVKAEENKTAI